MTETTFDLERLKQLHHKAQHEDLTPEEKQEVVRMANDFTGSLAPLVQSMADLHGEMAENLTEALEPLAKYADVETDQ